MAGNTTKIETVKDEDQCCGGCDGDEDDDKLELDRCDIDNNEQDDCCGSGGCSNTTKQTELKSNANYGSINNNDDTVKDSVVAGCNKGCC